MRVILIDPLLRDAFFAAIMDWALLWVCGRILRLERRWVWLTIAAILGGIYQLSLGIRWQLGTIFGWDMVLFLFVGGFIAWLAYPDLHLTPIIRRVFLFYLLTILTVGVSMGTHSLLQMLGMDRLAPGYYFLVNMGSLLIVTELGWGMIREAVRTHSHLVKIHIQLGEKEFNIKGLIDTGNMLRDPITKTPVVILSLPAVRTMLPGEAVQLVEQLLDGELPNESMDGFWLGKAKILPFYSVGNSQGLLVGLTAEKLEISAPSNLILKPAVLGFTPQRFSTGDYQAILPAALFDQFLSV